MLAQCFKKKKNTLKKKKQNKQTKLRSDFILEN